MIQAFERKRKRIFSLRKMRRKAQVTVEVPAKPVPLWKQKLYYGYNFDIYFHHDTKKDSREKFTTSDPA